MTPTKVPTYKPRAYPTVAELFGALGGRMVGSGAKLHCPGHKPDENPSLDAKPSGRADRGPLLICRAGCPQSRVLKALQDLDLWPVPEPKHATNGAKRRTWATLDAAIKGTAPSGTTEGLRWTYFRHDGTVGMDVVRFNRADGSKEFRPYHRGPDGWVCADPPGELPLYRLPEIVRATGTIFVCEGEQCCKAAGALGLTATTSAHGAKAPHKTDWSPLAGREVVVLPDADANHAGLIYAETVAKILIGLDPPASVRIVELPGLPEGGDIVDFIEAHDSIEADAIREQIEVMAQAAPVVHSDSIQTAGKRRRLRADRSALPLCTDVGNGLRFAARHGPDVRYCHPWSRWLVWDGTRWKEDDRGEIAQRAKATATSIFAEAARASTPQEQELVGKWAITSQKHERLNAMIACARSEPGIPILPTELDCDIWLFNCANGLLDLRTGELLPHDRSASITKLSSVPFEPHSKAERFQRFMAEIMDDNELLIGFLQRMLGYCLSGDVTEHILPIFWGSGRNGKNTLLEAVLYVLGDYGCMAPHDLLTVRQGEEHPTILADLHGRRLIVASETEEGKRLRVQLVKALTGDARIKARKMRMDYFEFARSNKTILVTNNRPVVTEQTTAIWSRLKLVPFTVSFEGREDKRLADALKAEASGILKWLVDGCLAWQRDGLGEPEAVVEATAGYRSDQDAVSPFLEERCLVTPEAKVSRSALWPAYSEWVKRSLEKRPLDRDSLYDRLRHRGFTDCFIQEHGRSVRGFAGIGLLTG